jgi:hypothetical protein
MKADVSMPLWVCITHLFNHQTHHRGRRKPARHRPLHDARGVERPRMNFALKARTPFNLNQLDYIFLQY